MPALRAYIWLGNGTKGETADKLQYDVVSIHSTDAPRPHAGMRVMRTHAIIEGWPDDTGLFDEIVEKTWLAGEHTPISYPYAALKIDEETGLIDRVRRSMRWLDIDMLPSQLKGLLMNPGRAVPIIDAAKVQLTIRTREKPTGTLTRGSGGVMR